MLIKALEMPQVMEHKKLTLTLVFPEVKVPSTAVDMMIA